MALKHIYLDMSKNIFVQIIGSVLQHTMDTRMHTNSATSTSLLTLYLYLYKVFLRDFPDSQLQKCSQCNYYNLALLLLLILCLGFLHFCSICPICANHWHVNDDFITCGNHRGEGCPIKYPVSFPVCLLGSMFSNYLLCSIFY